MQTSVVTRCDHDGECHYSAGEKEHVVLFGALRKVVNHPLSLTQLYVGLHCLYEFE